MVAKTDVCAYLAAVYGVQTTYIHTDNYIAPLCRSWNAAWVCGMSHSTYKRAVVWLVEPFYYPNMLEDMSKEVREAREDFLGQQYHVKSREDMARTCPFLTCLHPLSDHLPRW